MPVKLIQIFRACYLNTQRIMKVNLIKIKLNMTYKTYKITKITKNNETKLILSKYIISEHTNWNDVKISNTFCNVLERDNIKFKLCK